MITLNILFNTDKTEQLSALDLDVKLSDCEVREMTFYNINAISPHYSENNDYCLIHSNAVEFICVETYQEVKDKLK